MSGRYLTDMADVLRRAGLLVTEVGSGPNQVGDAWKYRARGSGGYSSGRPNAVMVHHTASGASADGWSDVNYCTFNDSDAPLCNLYLSRAGLVWACAAGATNTNGSGGPLGPVPKDSMNSCAIGIEAGNNGTGEPWPDSQCRAYTMLAKALCDAYGIPPAHCYSHAEWAPGRKVDPAGPSRWASSGTWAMAGFRSDVAAGWPGGGSAAVPEPAPPSALDFMEEPMFIITAPNKGVALVAINGSGVEWQWIYTGEDQTAFAKAGVPTVTTTAAQFDALLAAAGNPVMITEV